MIREPIDNYSLCKFLTDNVNDFKEAGYNESHYFYRVCMVSLEKFKLIVINIKGMEHIFLHIDELIKYLKDNWKN